MPSIRLLFLWHMHQPYYKDLVTQEFRLPWVRMHGLKDYYGMVKLLDEFPHVHQTFNLVPSLIAQIQDYVSGSAQDPFFDAATKPAGEMSAAQRAFALRYLFQANLDHMIRRWPRYYELWEKWEGRPESQAAATWFTDGELTDLQVLSQVAWFDEFLLERPEVRELTKKDRGYTLEDQRSMARMQQEFLAEILPAYASAQARGSIEISTSPFYHPILPLLCDTDMGAISNPNLPSPSRRFRRPEDAREQIDRALALHEQVFGVRPRGLWPSEGSVSNEILAIAHQAGLKWVATDEGVLGRSLGTSFQRDGQGRLHAESAEKVYQIYKWEQNRDSVRMVFRDHSISDLIGFVYSGVAAQDAATDFLRRIRESCTSLLSQGKDATVSIILDGENAWEYYPQSGREFLRRLYDGIQSDPQFEPLTISEALEREPLPEKLPSIFPGSWIDANFDIWVGAPEDNLSWDHLYSAREFFDENARRVSDRARGLAFEELLIAEGSDWNWWYGPQHHSANDREFDELYRKHLANVYYAMGATPPDALAQPIFAGAVKAGSSPQTAYISPNLRSPIPGYFDWLGAAVYNADLRSSSMHRRSFLLDVGYAGIDAHCLYCRLDFSESASDWSAGATLVVTIESEAQANSPAQAWRLEAAFDRLADDGRNPDGQTIAIPTTIEDRRPDDSLVSVKRLDDHRVVSWSFRRGRGEAESGSSEGIQENVSQGRTEAQTKVQAAQGIAVELRQNHIFMCAIPLRALALPMGARLGIRFSLWRSRLPLDALPQEGAIELRLVPEKELEVIG
ncbi:MAG TPA: glycoside hydrolase family 57 protein [Candidatus Angelobacter sp.]|nr:glycoside hydrolase family 57 protein [Candidatus Angelobacter sp.]